MIFLWAYLLNTDKSKTRTHKFMYSLSKCGSIVYFFGQFTSVSHGRYLCMSNKSMENKNRRDYCERARTK